MNSRQRKRIRNRQKMIIPVQRIIPVDSVPSIIKNNMLFYITIKGTITHRKNDGTVITEEKEFFLI